MNLKVLDVFARSSEFLACLDEVQEELLYYPRRRFSLSKLLKFLR